MMFDLSFKTRVAQTTCGTSGGNAWRFLFHKPKCEAITINPAELQKITALLEQGRENVWYNSAAWKSIRAYVLKLDNNECQLCKKRGRYKKAVIVHHVKHLKDRPDLALSVYDPDTNERQLLSVCKRCHEDLHPEAQRQYAASCEPITEERWD